MLRVPEARPHIIKKCLARDLNERFVDGERLYAELKKERGIPAVPHSSHSCPGSVLLSIDSYDDIDMILWTLG